MAQFIKLIGFNTNETVTVNFNYLIRFEPNSNGGTDVYVDNKTGVIHYHAAIGYEKLNLLVNEHPPQ